MCLQGNKIKTERSERVKSEKERPGMQRAIVTLEANVVIKEDSIAIVPGHNKVLDVKIIHKDGED